jgi:hypothetical protein
MVGFRVVPGPLYASRTELTRSHNMPLVQRILLFLGGFTFVLVGCISSAWYVQIAEPIFANDFWWKGYNLSGHESFLIDILNAAPLETTTNRSGSFDVFTPVMFRNYNEEASFSSFSHEYARRLLLSDWTSIEYAIRNLRRLEMRSVWIGEETTQYCWVDFDREFEVAHTEKRQARCAERYRGNGAVYLESVLRNVNWDAFMRSYGGPGNLFTVAIQLALEESEQGQQWLNKTSRARAQTSIHDELVYWQAYNLSTCSESVGRLV